MYKRFRKLFQSTDWSLNSRQSGKFIRIMNLNNLLTWLLWSVSTSDHKQKRIYCALQNLCCEFVIFCQMFNGYCAILLVNIFVIWMFVCLFLCIQRPTEWPVVNLSNLQGSVYLPNDGRLSSVAKEDSSHLAAVIKMGWLDKNPPQGYEWQHVHTYAHKLRFCYKRAIHSTAQTSAVYMTSMYGLTVGCFPKQI